MLIDGASLPSREQLPESLWPLLRRNAMPVDSGRDFHAQLSRLIRDLRLQLDPAGPPVNAAAANPASLSATVPPAQPVNWRSIGRWVLLMALIITLGAIAITGANSDRDKPQQSTTVEPPEPPQLPPASQ